MSKGGGTQTVTQNSDPWSQAQPYLLDLMGSAQNLYANRVGQEYYPFSTVVPFSDQTEMGLQAIENRALSGSPVTDGARGFLSNAFGGNPYAGQLQGIASGSLNNQGGGYGLMSNVANGAALNDNPYGTAVGSFLGGGGNDPAAYWAEIAGKGGLDNNNPYMGTLQQTAQGQFLNANPYLDAAMQKAANFVTDNVNSNFSMAGRWGSGAHQDVLQQGLGDIANQMLMSNYQSERQNQLGAAGQIVGQSQSDLDRRLQGLGLYSNINQSDLSRDFSAANTLYGGYANDKGLTLSAINALSGMDAGNADRQFTAANNLYSGFGNDYANMLRAATIAPDFAQSDYNDAQMLMNAGSTRESMANAYLADLMGRYDFQNQAPWNALNNYNSIVNSFGGLGGTSTQTGPRTGTSAFNQAIGSGLGLAGLGQMLGLWGTGAATGGLLGSLGGAVSGLGTMFLSDEDAKEDRKSADTDSILEMFADLPIDTYRYKEGKGDGGKEPRIGPMAQDWAKMFGGDGKTIPMPQAIGMLMAAVKELAMREDA